MNKKVLRDINTGDIVTLPCRRKNFRNETDLIVSAELPKHEGSTGRVYTENGYGFYPAVYGLRWE